MPFNVLLLPLLGGYVFLSLFNGTRFDARRYSGERLILHAAIWGTYFLLLSFIVTRIVEHASPGMAFLWRERVPFPYAGTSLGAFLIGSVAWLPLNRLFKRAEHAKASVKRWGDFLEVMLWRAIEGPTQISVTLKSGKVYTGFVTETLDPAFDRKYLLIFPMGSGFRDDQKRIVFTEDYAEVYEQLDLNELLPDYLDKFQLVIPVSEIASANLFEPDAYELFNPPRPESSR